MATVYLAHDRRHDAPVALKVMRREFASLLAGERFAREIRITARLQHPHILPVLDSGAAGGLPFYTMPYVEGETLGAWLARERQLPVADALRIASEVADALAYAHARGFVHRDLKPANILVAGHGPLGASGATAGGAGHGAWHALLADFGIARVVDAEADERARRTGGAGAGAPERMRPAGSTR
jgi:serine/threonine-protein kinase